MKKPLQFIQLLFLFLLLHQMAFAQVRFIQPDLDIKSISYPAITKIDVRIFPNPNSGVFKVVWEEEGFVKAMKVVNALGKQVASEDVYEKKEQQFDLSNQPNGLYFLKVVTREGESLTKIYIEE